VTLNSLPLTPERLWAAIQQARKEREDNGEMVEGQFGEFDPKKTTIRS
jgi:hypothetical protein